MTSWESEDKAVADVYVSYLDGTIYGKKPGKTKITFTFKSGFTADIEVTVLPERPFLIGAYNGAKGIGIKFWKVNYATHYVIYRKYKGIWSKIRTINANSPELQVSGDSLMYTDSSVKEKYGEGYIYSVQVKAGSLESDYNTTGCAIYRLKPPTLAKAVNNAAGIVTVNWKGVFGKTETNGKYDLQVTEYKNGKAGTFKSVTKLPGFNNLTLSAKVSGFKSGTYVFRIRCSKTNKDRGTYYSEYSPWLSVKITKPQGYGTGTGHL